MAGIIAEAGLAKAPSTITFLQRMTSSSRIQRDKTNSAGWYWPRFEAATSKNDLGDYGAH